MGQRMKGAGEMSKPAFTPGPWRQHPASETTIVRYVGDRWEDVANTFQGETDYRENYARREADARLIAAAPDLLEAAKAVAKWVETRPVQHPYDAWQMLNAAIAKAEGLP
jgi:hypothetical protein